MTMMEEIGYREASFVVRRNRAYMVRSVIVVSKTEAARATTGSFTSRLRGTMVSTRRRSPSVSIFSPVLSRHTEADVDLGESDLKLVHQVLLVPKIECDVNALLTVRSHEGLDYRIDNSWVRVRDMGEAHETAGGFAVTLPFVTKSFRAASALAAWDDPELQTSPLRGHRKRKVTAGD